MGTDADQNEAERLAVLGRTGLLDSPPEPAFDDLVSLAARMFDVPVALVSLVDADRLWLKARVGVDVSQIPRGVTLCEMAIRSGDLLVFKDCQSDPRLAGNPFAADGPSPRFYAGYPLLVTGGWALGTFCLIDFRPRTLSAVEKDALVTLARSAGALVDLRLRQADLESALADRDRTARALTDQAMRLAEAQRIARLGSWDYRIDTDELSWSEEVFSILGIDRESRPSRALWLSLIQADDRERNAAAEERLLDGRAGLDIELRMVRPDGELRHTWSRAEIVDDERGRRLVGTIQDITERKQMEARLLRAESDLALAGRLTRTGAWSVDLRAGTVTWSDEVYAIHEVEPATPIGIDEGIDFFAPESRELARQDFEACVRDGLPFDREHEIITARGRRTWIRGVGQPQRNAAGAIVGVRGAFQDIQAHKQNELEVRRLAERLESTLDGVTDVFLTVDYDWHATYLNAAGERRMGMTRDQLLGRAIWEVFPQAVGTDLYRHTIRAMEERVPVAAEFYFAPTTSWLNLRAYPIAEGLAIFYQDVSERRGATEALRESEERLRLVIRATADTIWENNLRTGDLWWSEDFPERLGYPKGDLVPTFGTWRQLVHQDDLERVLAVQRAAFEDGSDSWEADYRLVRRDGSVIHVFDRAFLMRDAEGAVVREVGGLTDVSHRVEYEERLHQAQRLEAIGQLTGGIAHDFNNLLTIILGNAELLGERAGDDRSRRLAEMTASAAQRGADLTSRLLSFARRQTLYPKPVDVNRLVAGMDELMRRTLGEQIEIEIVRGGGLWSALADPVQLESAILNLCINARDAMSGGGRLSIETANVHLDDRYAGAHDGIRPGQYVMVAVGDTGTGMTPEVVTQAFQPFYTTKGPGKGSGLGLSVVYGFVKQSDGHVKIYSEVGEGTTVKVYLPRADAPVADAAVSPEMPERGGVERILVVEDDDLVRSHVTQQVRALGYSVVAAANGPEAVEILRSDEPFDLLFTDVVMPGGMNGRQVADEARRLRPGLRVLFTSGYTENAIVHHGRLDRGVHLINKPYRRQDLARKLRLVLDEPALADQ